jgi:NAD(P)-dependent dehydrogenase (short-subunit alcohol dehydrogenase family)
MRRHKKAKGSVINMSSVAGLIGSATAQLAYTASKGAVIAMTRELGIVHAREGFRFNSLCPGPLNSPMLQVFLDGEDIEGSTKTDRRERREVHLPQGRWGEPAEVAAAALFLASDASSFVNSTELVVDGGLTKVSRYVPYSVSCSLRRICLLTCNIGICDTYRTTSSQRPSELCIVIVTLENKSWRYFS